MVGCQGLRGPAASQDAARVLGDAQHPYLCCCTCPGPLCGRVGRGHVGVVFNFFPAPKDAREACDGVLARG